MIKCSRIGYSQRSCHNCSFFIKRYYDLWASKKLPVKNEYLTLMYTRRRKMFSVVDTPTEVIAAIQSASLWNNDVCHFAVVSHIPKVKEKSHLR